jgi:lysophospholipase L1-like esterase
LSAPIVLCIIRERCADTSASPPEMRARALWRLLLACALLVALLEGVAWLLLPAPPDPDSQDGRTQRFAEAFYVPDPGLIVRLRPGVQGNFSSFWSQGRDVPVTTNRDGFRGADWEPPDPQALRLLVFGDSVTFGFLLREEEAWPALLRARLEQRLGRRVQLRNLAVPGYSSTQSRILCERALQAPDFRPDLVLFASGWNDSFLNPVDDAAMQRSYAFLHGSALGAIVRFLQRSHVVRLLATFADRTPVTPRVSQAELKDNLERVVRACRNTRLLLIDSNLPNRYATQTFAEVAAAGGAGFLSFRDVLERRKGIDQGVAWPQDGAVVLAVSAHGVAVPPSPDERPPFHVLLLPDARDRRATLRIALRDDGLDGDLAADDGVWSTHIDGRRGLRPQFACSVPGLAAALPTFASDAGLLNGVHFWTLPFVAPGADGSPAVVREDRASAGGPWPEWILGSDPIHPSAEGNAVLAEAVTEAALGLLR